MAYGSASDGTSYKESIAPTGPFEHHGKTLHLVQTLVGTSFVRSYINNPREALKELNLARKDSRWGSSAILHMVEIYLNPDNDAVWEEKENADTPESREAVATARSLLKQVGWRGSAKVREVQVWASAL